MATPDSSPPLDPVSISEDLAPFPHLKSAGDTSISFDGQLDVPIRLHEDVRTGCGGQTWPAGMVLGKHMLRYHREELEGGVILELGAGGGLVGLAVAAGCRLASKLLMTDQEAMLALMRHNILLNDFDHKVEALVLNWGDPLPELVVAQKPSIILAAECVYFEPAFPLLLQTLRELFALNEAAVVYFCFKKRRRADMQFVKRAKRAFLVEEPGDEERGVFSRAGLFLFTFRSRTARDG